MIIVLLWGCRADPGQPVYPVYPPWDPGLDTDFLPGPFPYVDGDERLSFGLFYEGAASETVEIDDVTTHYYIYEGTYTQALSDERVEGLSADVLVVSGAQLWWGGGIVWDNPADLSDWTTLHVSLRATDALFEDMVVAVTGGAESRVRPSNYGFAADGEWHSLAIPLSAFAGASLAQVTIPVSFVADAGTVGSELSIDDLYFTKE